MNSIGAQLDGFQAQATINPVVVPDLWQQQAITALREGRDVVVHAPTGAGKTLVFEQWSNGGRNRGQAVYTVPTRALANDKLAEWRACGWDVGIATGDLSENLAAPVIVATLETQKNRLIQGDGPALLVVDEYQMIADPDRGLNYELALALAPPGTQLLLLSGSVGNPRQVVSWLQRLGRDAVLVRHDHRPVPLEEVHAHQLRHQPPSSIRGYWPRLAAQALAEDLGPILIFAPRRQAAEMMAAELARYLPASQPLTLTDEQRQIVGEHVARMLKSRVAYHHSGLSYTARAGVIEPLAKAGQLRVVVATMGLAAGINFSLRSVALAGASYRRGHEEQPLRADEILQMFGRAGRRGLDETGYVIVTANEVRLLDAHACQLARNGSVDWGALLGVMQAAVEAGLEPFAEAVRVQERLFTSKPIVLGVEQALRHPQTPCGLATDAERARLVRRKVRQMRNSAGEWENYPPPRETRLSEVFVLDWPGIVRRGAAGEQEEPPSLRSALTEPRALEKIGPGFLIPVDTRDARPVFGRATTVADRLRDGRVVLAKWVRRLIGWNGRQTTAEQWRDLIAARLRDRLAGQGLPVVRFDVEPARIVALLSLAEQRIRVPVDSRGVALWRPPEREVPASWCATCPLVPVCQSLPPATGVALLWRRLGLVDAGGRPTRRGRVVSFFTGGDGLALAAALEDASYPVNELAYDLANLDAGFRFAGDENRWSGRLAQACRAVYGQQSVPGYLENGLPPKYGAGAEAVVASVHKNPLSKHRWVKDFLGAGDIDRIIIEWRSLLRRIAHAPPLDWTRWRELQAHAAGLLRETESPTLTTLPPLSYEQTKRIDHRLRLRPR